MSRFHRVLEQPVDGMVPVEDAAGSRHMVSLLAYEGAEPRPGDWVVVHTGYALAPADPEEAEATMADLRWAAAGLRRDRT